MNGRYPYPGTENWQKTIGAFLLWIEAELSAPLIDWAWQAYFGKEARIGSAPSTGSRS